MKQSEHLECLKKIASTSNPPLTPEKIKVIKERIGNYTDFYSKNYNVPASEIFYSAVISSQSLIELCKTAVNVRIFITKDTDTLTFYREDFNFNVLQADSLGVSPLDGGEFDKPTLIEACCCRYPPDNDSLEANE